ncbi:MAG: bifunctional methylenetetrahydrofolate dehydrogenase/methenyltetrahydrofolate cyclohydrolase FolD [Lachnospiraceae bacterium]|nr:bifunctional methylenetetrahydrofolate dehydrogenase/methenyltetrahydrofolate cyclohydrolase FolD [Lachnospiraceae bacterium]
MGANLIDGKAIAAQIKDEVRQEVSALKVQGSSVTLAVILVGDDPASAVYVRNKKKACEAVGIESVSIELPADTTQEELLERIASLNAREDVDGILVQLPLPRQIDERAVIDAIDPAKDVDGFHPVNVGLLAIGEPAVVSCTPAGVIELLTRSGVEIEGKEAVVIGRSNIVGKPMAHLLLQRHATVTIAHSRTKNLREVIRRADIVVAAVGKPRMIGASDIKEGAVVIDVGINRDMETGKLCGDVDFDSVAPHCSAITPVPGGVGPMTIAMLMRNCCELAKKRNPPAEK